MAETHLPRTEYDPIAETLLSVAPIPDIEPCRFADVTKDEIGAALNHDDCGSNRSKVRNVIDTNILERDAGGKPHHTFPHPALGKRYDVWLETIDPNKPGKWPCKIAGRAKQ